MSAIGSVFLGDRQRNRLFSSSSSTPPSSPSPTAMTTVFAGVPRSQSPLQPVQVEPAPESKPATIDPVLSLELRLRWLEAILIGVRTDKERKGKEKPYELKHGESLIRAAEDIQRRLDSVVRGHDGLKRFMEHYEQNAHLLTASFALSGSIPDHAPSYDNMSPSELEAFLLEMEPDIRAADRDMREIEDLEKKGVTGAGKLPEYEALQPRLDKLLKTHQEDLTRVASLERRIATLMKRHATHVDTLSELFVEWDSTLAAAEDQVAKLEREKVDRGRLGLA